MRRLNNKMTLQRRTRCHYLRIVVLWTVEYPVDGEDLMIRRSLNVQIKDDDLEQHRKNNFHTRCHISNKVSNMIIDSRNCANVVSAALVKKSNLNIIKHERPYKFYWVNECGE
jgi:hypothetical protein